MTRRFATVAAGLALVVFHLSVLWGQAAVGNITLVTVDGNKLTGTIDLDTVGIESSLGTVEVKFKNVSSLDFTNGMATILTPDGTTVRGRLLKDSWKIATKVGEFTIKTSDIGQMSINVVQAQKPSQPPESDTPLPGQPEPTLKPVRTLELRCSLGGLCASSEGKKLCVLNVSDSRLLIIDVASFEVEKEIPLRGGETVFAITDDAKTAFASGQRSVSVVDLVAGKVATAFAVEHDIQDMLARDERALYATSRTGNGALIVISIPKQSVVQTIPEVCGRLKRLPGSQRAYLAFGSFLLPGKEQAEAEIDFSKYGRESIGPNFEVSPDGGYAVSTSGVVYRIGQGASPDVIRVAKVEENRGCGFAPASKRLLVITKAGELHEYDLGTFKSLRTHFLGLRSYGVVVDELRHVMYILAPAKGTPEFGLYQPDIVPLGVIHEFALPK